VKRREIIRVRNKSQRLELTRLRDLGVPKISERLELATKDADISAVNVLEDFQWSFFSYLLKESAAKELYKLENQTTSIE
jgi:hypothetical protein